MGRRRKAWLPNGTGKMAQRGNSLPGYYARFYDYQQDGSRINRTKHFLKQVDARRWVRQYNARLDLRQLGDVVPVPLLDAMTEFLAACSALARGTQGDYRTALAMLHSVTGDLDVCDITSTHIDSLIAARLKVSRPATVRKHLAYLHAFFRWAAHEDRHYATRNPVDGATTTPKGGDRRERPVVSDEDLTRLVAALDTDDRRIAVWLAMSTGLDRSKICQLRPHNLDLDEQTIRFIRPKTGKQNVVPIPGPLASVLAAKLQGWPPDQPLLSGVARQNNEKDWWKRAVKIAGLDGLYFRDLRAVATSRLLKAGASLKDAQALLGHASIQTTANHYAMPDPATRQRLNTLPIPGLPGAEESK